MQIKIAIWITTNNKKEPNLKKLEFTFSVKNKKR